VRSKKGFTVIELIFVIAIVGLLTSLAVFSTVKWIHEIKVRNFAEELFFDLEWARSLAFKKGKSQIVFRSNNYSIYVSDNSTSPIKEKETPEGITIKANLNFGRTRITFGRNKLPDIGGNIEIKEFGDTRYKIVINDISGRIYLEEIR
jgi:prepilin-type N-terminal cleavage/methylation domain-containing protein